MGRPLMEDVASSSDPQAHVIVCRSCHAHFAPRQNILRSMPGGNLVFSNVVNVKVDGPEKHREEGMHTLADVQCVRCNNLLGCKFIKDDVQNLLGPEANSNEGQYHLLKETLGQWTLANTFKNVADTDFVP